MGILPAEALHPSLGDKPLSFMAEAKCTKSLLNRWGMWGMWGTSTHIEGFLRLSAVLWLPHMTKRMWGMWGSIEFRRLLHARLGRQPDSPDSIKKRPTSPSKRSGHIVGARTREQFWLAGLRSILYCAIRPRACARKSA